MSQMSYWLQVEIPRSLKHHSVALSSPYKLTVISGDLSHEYLWDNSRTNQIALNIDLCCSAPHVPYLLYLLCFDDVVSWQIYKSYINSRCPLCLNSRFFSPNIAWQPVPNNSSKPQRFQKLGNNEAHPKALGHVWPEAKYLGHNSLWFKGSENRRSAKSI